MAKAKDDPFLNRLFEGPDGGKSADGAHDDARDAGEADEAYAALRRDVLGILDGAGDGSPVEPLDDGLIAAYLDGALEGAERTALEARLAASHVLREQVAAAASMREAGLESGLALPPDFAADYDAVPGPAKAAARGAKARPAGLIGRLFGAPIPARRWLAATVPVLVVAVVAAVIGPQLIGDREKLRQGEGAGTAALKAPADAKVKRERAEEREADRARKAAPPKLAESAKPKAKADREPMSARRAGRAGAAGNKVQEKKTLEKKSVENKAREKKAVEKKAAKELAVVTTTIVPLSSELRDAVVVLGRSQQGAIARRPMPKDSEKPALAPYRPSTGSSADKSAGESRLDRPAPRMKFQRSTGVTQHYIDVINRAVAPDCTKNPALCCGSHRVDQDLLNRLLASRPPLQSLKVVRLSSRACYLTLP